MFPSISPAGYRSLGGGDHRWNAFMTYSGVVNLVQVRGAHTFKAGYDVRLIRVPNWEALSAGMFPFSASMTQGPDPNRASSTAGNGLASMILGAGGTAASTANRLVQNWKNPATTTFTLPTSRMTGALPPNSLSTSAFAMTWTRLARSATTG
jgi:hypothetical protein